LTMLAECCPAGFSGDASAAECDETPVRNVALRVGRPCTDFVCTAHIRDEGVVTFALADLTLPGTVGVPENLPTGIAHVVACWLNVAGISMTFAGEPFPDNDPPNEPANASDGIFNPALVREIQDAEDDAVAFFTFVLDDTMN
jgi:hypothetical protein